MLTVQRLCCLYLHAFQFVVTNPLSCRSSLLAYKRWQGQVETAGQDVQGALGTLTSSWQDMRDRVAQLARDHQDAEIMQQVGRHRRAFDPSDLIDL